MRRTATLLWLLIIGMPNAIADEITVAVAANFQGPMQVIARLFERETGHRVIAAYGATGKFHAQIANGAPFEVLLAADSETPSRLAREGSAIAASVFTYAIGRLVLWSADPKRVDAQGEILRQGSFRHLAIANPKTAPYGAAAIATMNKLGVLETARPFLVQGESVAQAHQFAASGAADLAFVAYSQVIRNDRIGSGSGWIVPAGLHDPIRQDAAILDKGKDKPAVLALLAYLRSDKAKAVIRSFGYDLP